MADAHWILEEGIGEVRAALVVDGAIVEGGIEPPGGLRAGAVTDARLVEIIAPGRVGLVALSGGGEALVQPLPSGPTHGAPVRVEITREAIGHKRALCRVAAPHRMPGPGPNLAARITATGTPVRQLFAHEPDLLEEAGWSELMEEAATGAIAFTGGALLMALTPAMTLFDVDGRLPPDELCVAGAAATGRAIRRLGIAGSIGIDLPTVADRVGRQAAAAALDAALPPPFERTAINGFGFVQIVRPQARASLPQLLAADRIGAAARALLRRAERTGGHGARTLTAHAGVVARLRSEVEWMEFAERRTGAPVGLRIAQGIGIDAGYVETRSS